MENVKEKFFFFDKKLRRRFTLYVVSSAVLVCVVTLCVVAYEYCLSYNATLIELQRERMNLFRVRDATAQKKHEIEKIEGLIKTDYFKHTSETQVLAGLDAIRQGNPGSSVTFSNFVYGDAEITLPVVLKGNVGDYGSFIRDVGNLQSMKFPFFAIRTVMLRKEGLDGKVTEEGQGKKVAYEIQGDLRLPKSMQPVQKNMTATTQQGRQTEVQQ